ncbi:unnamed protein product [Peronospora destructor]|uniref:J domain-containing protein n=1 Tax=Peronospora destructor TaxID=86335 RepID=A0AAV0V488_9STRA|nr:unnamed protein product [Peronospora destructor]
MTEASRILNCSTHYGVLKLDQVDHAPTFVDTQQVRRHYKELAILVHPDKNRATDAEAAFKRLSEAYECLVDKVSQCNYLQQLQVTKRKTGAKTTKQEFKYRRKTKSGPKSGESDDVPLTRRRTPEEIWQIFQREEEELARQQFQAKGFDRVYSKRNTDAAITSMIPSEAQQDILYSKLDVKAAKWATWNKPALKRMKMTMTVSEPAHETGVVSTAVDASDISTTLVCFCMLCRRQFRTVEALNRHEALSKLHLANLQAEQRNSNEHP